MHWRNWLNAVIGLWFIVSPWALRVSDQAYVTWSSVIVGIVLVVVSVWAALTVDIGGWKVWQNWVSLVCGLWFVIHPFLGHFEEGSYYAIVSAAILSMALSLWTLMKNPESMGHESTV